MLDYYVSTALFLLIPIAIIAFFAVSLCKYVSAKKKNKKTPGAVIAREMDRLKTVLIVSSVAAGVLLAAVIGITVLMYLAVAYM